MRRVISSTATVVAVVALLAACGASAPAPGVPTSAATSAGPTSGGPTSPGAPTAPAAGAATAGVATVPVTAAHPCVGAPAPAAWRHVIWIWFENKASSSVVGSSSAPYLTGLAAACASATDYHGVAHPSLPNYLAATSGSTHGVTDDAGPSTHPLPGSSLFSQVSAAGLPWRAYVEGMPAPCSSASAGGYAVKHNPAAYYTDLRADCRRWDVGLEALSADLATGDLPAFAFVTPNLCHDMHDCPVAAGDAWLSGMLPALLGSAAYARGDTAVFVTWDEDDGSHTNTVPLLVIAPSLVPGTTIGRRLDHYALLRTTERMLGLPPLGNAASAAVIPGL